jgi:FAD:protein FMN transferase
MASRAQLILVDPADGAEAYARRRLDELERRWSRFLPASDVSRLNGTAGGLMLVSPESLILLDAMKTAWRATDGRYDPTLLDAVVAAGYDESIDGSGRRCRASARRTAACTIEDVGIDPLTGAVSAPRGVGVDPGGIGKGLAADIVVTELLERGTRGALVAIGGDLAAGGTPPAASGWPIGVEDPRDPDSLLFTFVIASGGVATSSTLSRRWTKDGAARHHTIDPRTGACATTDLSCVTVVARAGWEAEAHATAGLLCGLVGAIAYLARHELDGVALALDGTLDATPAMAGVLPDDPAGPSIVERSIA